MKQIFLLLAFLGAGFSLQAQTQTAAQTGADIATLTADENKGPNEAKDTDINLLKAALKGWHVRVGAGVSIGGSAPPPIPAEIRKIDSYNPTLCIQLEGDAHKKFGKHWGMMVGVRFENKGMETDATMKNYHMEAVNVDGSGKIIGAFTGKVNTEVDLNYLTFPILATYSFNDRWQIAAGPYLSWMMKGEFTGKASDGYIRDQNPTGTKTEVTMATYDFSHNLRRFQWGLQVGGEFKAYKHLSVTANVQWGLNGIFPSDFQSVTFDLFPIYGTIGFNYLF